MHIAIIGAGWAGLAGAVQALRQGHCITLFEASHAAGGRARALAGSLPDGTPVSLDNGQHILIGAYTETLALMRQLGVSPEAALLRLPLALCYPHGEGLRLPDWPSPLNALAGILRARGWSWHDKLSLLRVASGWQRQGFWCPADTSVARLCAGLSPRLQQQLIEPLCVSALNTPAAQASAQVFLRVLKDSLFGARASADLLLPRLDLSQLLPVAALAWLQRSGQARINLGERVQALHRQPGQWLVNGTPVDRVLLATSCSNAALVLENSAQAAPETIATELGNWITAARALRFEAITTVYAWAPAARLARPMLALHSQAMQDTDPTGGASAQTCYPAQFVFDRGQLGGPAGLLAFVVSASHGERALVQAQVLAQARAQLGLDLQAVQTIVEKRATFACTPALVRPPMHIATGLLACGDYVAGPYPATLEGAVRSGQAAAQAL